MVETKSSYPGMKDKHRLPRPDSIVVRASHWSDKTPHAADPLTRTSPPQNTPQPPGFSHKMLAPPAAPAQPLPGVTCAPILAQRGCHQAAPLHPTRATALPQSLEYLSLCRSSWPGRQQSDPASATSPDVFRKERVQSHPCSLKKQQE